MAKNDSPPRFTTVGGWGSAAASDKRTGSPRIRAKLCHVYIMETNKQTQRSLNFRRQQLRAHVTTEDENDRKPGRELIYDIKTKGGPALNNSNYKAASPEAVIGVLLGFNRSTIAANNHNKDAQSEMVTQINALTKPLPGSVEDLQMFHALQFTSATMELTARRPLKDEMAAGALLVYYNKFSGRYIEDGHVYFTFNFDLQVSQKLYSEKRSASQFNNSIEIEKFSCTMSPWAANEFCRGAYVQQLLDRSMFPMFSILLAQYGALFGEREKIFQKVEALALSLSPSSFKRKKRAFQAHRGPVLSLGSHNLIWQILVNDSGTIESRLFFYCNGKTIMNFNTLVKAHGIVRSVEMLLKGQQYKTNFIHVNAV